ncbi:MAG: S8 family serine peptidase [Anaeroplasmataceae bacterium]|nr:S8 family serine peptidase [Anaeroplasmataceae bacterium]
MRHLKLMLCSLVIAIVSLIGVDLYYQSDFHLNNELKKKITFEPESAVLKNSSLNEDEENYEYEITGSNIMIELSSDFDSYSLRDMYINSGETDYDFILSEIRSEAKSYYTELRSEFADKYHLDIYKEFSSPFVNIHSDKVLEDVNDLDNNLKKAILDSDVICSFISKDLTYTCFDGGGGGGGDPYPDKETPSGFLGKKEVLEKINASNTDLDGSGINIGIFEVCDNSGKLGLPNTSYLYGLSVQKRGDNGEFSSHATAVTKCVSWLAPKSNYYCGSVDTEEQGNTKRYEATLNWLLEKQINVINMSFSTYIENTERQFDMYAKDNFISLVVSAGNNSYCVTTPGICYNVITVGATNVECTDRADFSCYRVPYSIAKPNIMAPGEKIFFGGSITNNGKTYDSGTSFSAPIVTGAVAQLMQKRPILKLYPEAVQAVLYNTANQSMLASHDKYAGFDTENGAGMLDVKKALDNIFNYNLRTLTSNDYYKKTITMANIRVEAGQTLNVNLNWLISYDDIEKKKLMTDFDLYVYNSDGETISITNSTYNNSELARIPITKSGNYQICLYQFDSIKNPIEHIALAWSIT